MTTRTLGRLTIGGDDLTGGYIPKPYGESVQVTGQWDGRLTGSFYYDSRDGLIWPTSPTIGPNGPGGILALQRDINAKAGFQLPFAPLSRIFAEYAANNQSTTGIGYNGPSVINGVLQAVGETPVSEADISGNGEAKSRIAGLGLLVAGLAIVVIAVSVGRRKE